MDEIHFEINAGKERMRGEIAFCSSLGCSSNVLEVCGEPLGGRVNSRALKSKMKNICVGSAKDPSNVLKFF